MLSDDRDYHRNESRERIGAVEQVLGREQDDGVVQVLESGYVQSRSRQGDGEKNRRDN